MLHSTRLRSAGGLQIKQDIPIIGKKLACCSCEITMFRSNAHNPRDYCKSYSKAAGSHCDSIAGSISKAAVPGNVPRLK